MMEDQQFRDELVAELKRQRLPRAYIRRLQSELEDHISDLRDERTTNMHTARMPDSDSSDDGYAPGASDDVSVDELFRDL